MKFEAPAICGIHAELLKAGGNALLISLYAVLCSTWNTGIIPTDWKRGLVVPFWKGKGDPHDCNNYRGVALLSVPGKVFGRIVIDGVHHHLLEHQRSAEQSGFTPFQPVHRSLCFHKQKWITFDWRISNRDSNTRHPTQQLADQPGTAPQSKWLSAPLLRTPLSRADNPPL